MTPEQQKKDEGELLQNITATWVKFRVTLYNKESGEVILYVSPDHDLIISGVQAGMWPAPEAEKIRSRWEERLGLKPGMHLEMRNIQ